MNKELFLKLLIVLGLLPLIACNSQKKTNSCEKNMEKALICINNFYFYDTIESLDSAFVYIDQIKISRCPEYANIVNMQKVNINFLKGNFKEAIKILEAYNDEGSQPFFFNILINQIKAKEASINGDKSLEQQYYSYIIDDLEQYVDMHKGQINSMLTMPEMWPIFNEYNELESYFAQLYYYKYKLYGKEKIFNELDSIQKETDGNKEYLEQLKKSIFKEDGYEMRVLFE